MATTTKGEWVEVRMPSRQVRISASTLDWTGDRFGCVGPAKLFESVEAALAELATAHGPVSITRTSLGAFGSTIIYSTDLTVGGIHVQINERPEILERRVRTGSALRDALIPDEYRVPGFQPTHATA